MVDAMSKLFTFRRVESEAHKQAIYRLRYQTYVEEYGFEHPEDHPGGMEMDAYDAEAIHLAAFNTEAEVVGTLRLILQSELGFPCERLVPPDFLNSKPPPEHVAEISRLTIVAAYRRRMGDGIYGVESYIRVSEGGLLPDSGPIPAPYDKRQQPMIILGLYQLMYHISKRLGLSHWYMVTEEKLYHTLLRYHLLFEQIGPPINYHGIRIPYLGTIAKIEAYLRQENPEAYKLFVRE